MRQDTAIKMPSHYSLDVYEYDEGGWSTRDTITTVVIVGMVLAIGYCCYKCFKSPAPRQTPRRNRSIYDRAKTYDWDVRHFERPAATPTPSPTPTSALGETFPCDNPADLSFGPGMGWNGLD